MQVKFIFLLVCYCTGYNLSTVHYCKAKNHTVREFLDMEKFTSIVCLFVYCSGTECHGILRYGKIYEYSLFVCLFVYCTVQYSLSFKSISSATVCKILTIYSRSESLSLEGGTRARTSQ